MENWRGRILPTVQQKATNFSITKSLLISFLILDKHRSPNPLKANKEVVRKRRPINFTLDDLNGDEVEDESWRGNKKSFRNFISIFSLFFQFFFLKLNFFKNYFLEKSK